jgi:hypothetical protein
MPGRAGADPLADGVGERRRAGRVVDGVAVGRELGDEVQRDDRLAGAGPAADDEHRLGVEVAGLGDLGEDRLEHHLLLVEQHVGRLALDHRRGVVEQLLVRPVLALPDAAQHAEPAAVAEVVVEELHELGDPVAGEQRVDAEHVRVPWREQLGLVVVGEVVQVGAGAQLDVAVVERLVRVGEVLLVLADLRRGVQRLLEAGAVADRDHVLDPGGLDVVAPLLELDDHRSRAAVVVVAGDHRVQPLRGQRQLELEQQPVVEEPAELDRVRQGLQRVPPGAHLALGRVPAVVVEERLRSRSAISFCFVCSTNALVVPQYSSATRPPSSVSGCAAGELLA